MSTNYAGLAFRQAVKNNHPLAVVGCVNAYFARLATQSGFKAIYLSGGGVAACSRGIPDLGITSMEDVLTDAQRITDNVDTPLLVDIDVGWGGAFNIARTIRTFEKAGVAAVHIEDQVAQKRCGHRPNKSIVSKEEMVDRIKAAVDARVDDKFVIMARTDALAVEGLEMAIERAQAYIEAGADMLFPEAVTELSMYQQFANAVNVPVLANITEFGATPLYSQQELAEHGVSLVLYPLSSFRAASKAALNVYQSIMQYGTQKNVVDTMQTRAQLYEFLDYHSFEQKLDELYSKQ